MCATIFSFLVFGSKSENFQSFGKALEHILLEIFQSSEEKSRDNYPMLYLFYRIFNSLFISMVLIQMIFVVVIQNYSLLQRKYKRTVRAIDKINNKRRFKELKWVFHVIFRESDAKDQRGSKFSFVKLISSKTTEIKVAKPPSFTLHCLSLSIPQQRIWDQIEILFKNNDKGAFQQKSAQNDPGK